jgi:1,4-dihydroxy-6-naphthoate synthase
MRRASKRAAAAKVIHVAYTPDSDDMFNFYAWEHSRVAAAGIEARFRRAHIRTLNEAAQQGLYEVCAISSVVYPAIADMYWILGVGASVGRGYGPVLAAREARSIESLKGLRIGVPGTMTTGGYLARTQIPGATFITAPFDEIADGIRRGDYDAGVLIHEELVHVTQLGLAKVCDLGAAWSARSGLPLPVGLSVVKRSVGMDAATEIARTATRSLFWALDNKDEAMAFVRRIGRGRADDFVPMFSNNDTLRMPSDVRQGLRVLFDELASSGLARPLHDIEVIDA